MLNPPSCAAVLVVEDEADIREAIVEVLKVEGFHTEQATDGRHALEMLRRIPQPTLILADLMMPVMDGAALVAALREDDRLATLPVVIVTAADASAPHGCRLLKKPIDFDDLVRIVDELCVRAGRPWR
jgi:two-component system chemotaxis response regulator CheY